MTETIEHHLNSTEDVEGFLHDLDMEETFIKMVQELHPEVEDVIRITEVETAAGNIYTIYNDGAEEEAVEILNDPARWR